MPKKGRTVYDKTSQKERRKRSREERKSSAEQNQSVSGLNVENDEEGDYSTEEDEQIVADSNLSATGIASVLDSSDVSLNIIIYFKINGFGYKILIIFNSF